MTLNITSRWEHDIFGANDGNSYLVVTISADKTAAEKRAPIDLAFALDQSGSMGGQNKIELVKQAVLAAIEQMDEDDRVSLVTFDSDVQVRHNLTRLDADHRRHLERVTNAIQPGSSTNLSGGWLEACRQISEAITGSPRIRRTLLLTDGMANMGITRPAELATHARELRDRGISTSAIGVGEGFDEFLLSGMAEAGGGNFQYIANPAELEQFFSEELRSLAETVAMNPYLEVTMPHHTIAELVNAFPSESHNRHTSVDLRDLAAGDDVHLVFQVRARSGFEGEVTPELHLHWSNPHTGAVEEINQAGTGIATGDASKATRNDAVATIVALELAARDHRQAVELDRQGRYEDSRARFRESAVRLGAAPDTEEVRTYMKTSQDMSFMDANMPMPEHDRKSRVHESHARSRGRRRHGDEENPRRMSGGDHCTVTRSKEVRYEFFREAGEHMRGEGRRHFGEHEEPGEGPGFERRPHRGEGRGHGPRREFFREAGEHMRGQGRGHFGEHPEPGEGPGFERRPHRGEGRGHGPRREFFREAGEHMRGEGRGHFGEHEESGEGPGFGRRPHHGEGRGHGPRREFFREAGEHMRGKGRGHFGEHEEPGEGPNFGRQPHHGEGRGHGPRREFFSEAGEHMRGEGRGHFGERAEREFGPRGGQSTMPRRHRHGGPRRDRSRRMI